jgi:hypothetical protein
MDAKQQIERGILVCPRSRTRLSFDDGELVAATGDRYPLHHGVPILIDGAAQKDYLSQNDGSMVAEYEAEVAPAPAPGKLRGAVRRWLNLQDDYRSAASLAAFQQAILNQPPDAVLLSIGGGPQRQDPRLTNLNIGPFRNVDVVADAYCLPYADGSVDGVYCEAVLEHLEFPDRAAAEMARVLRPGGQLFAATPFLQPYHGYPNHFQNFTLTGHERLFLRHGLQMLASGVCVGPSFALSQLGLAYSLLFCRRLIRGRLLTALFGLLRKRDRRINQHPRAAEFASTTFVHCRKPQPTEA